jgi:hypothetical protein
MLTSNKALAKRLGDMERKYDRQFKVVFEVIHRLMADPGKEPRRIGF